MVKSTVASFRASPNLAVSTVRIHLIPADSLGGKESCLHSSENRRKSRQFRVSDRRADLFWMVELSNQNCEP